MVSAVYIRCVNVFFFAQYRYFYAFWKSDAFWWRRNTRRAGFLCRNPSGAVHLCHGFIVWYKYQIFRRGRILRRKTAAGGSCFPCPDGESLCRKEKIRCRNLLNRSRHDCFRHLYIAVRRRSVFVSGRFDF